MAKTYTKEDVDAAAAKAAEKAAKAETKRVIALAKGLAVSEDKAELKVLKAFMSQFVTAAKEAA